MQATFTKEEAHAFVDGGAGWVYLSTLGRLGRFAVVPNAMGCHR